MATSKKRVKDNRNSIYALPLPLLIQPIPSTLGIFGLSQTRVINPKCTGVFDAETQSVWIVNKKDTDILWQRGFFGKGNLSRSEPTWLSRYTNQLKGGQKEPTAEEIRERRRIERKQFKQERAEAIAAAAAEAEAIFRAEGKAPSETATPISVVIPSGSTRRTTASVTLAVPETIPEPGLTIGEDGTPTVELEEIPEDMEHLQLTLQEAFFLTWSLDCLRLLSPSTNEHLPLPAVWAALFSAHVPLPLRDSPTASKRFDNPFIVNYIVYHHFRSLGWVVKGGIKFCVDYLLYKRGPVFHHAEFAVILIPVYEDPDDEQTSPFQDQLPNTKPFTWSWLSTINRVNSQVKKSLVLAYVTIPSAKRVGVQALESPGQCLKEYSVREVVVKRWVPARTRD